jgi:hypothetical protein
LFPGKGLYTDNVVTSTSNIISSNFIEGGVSLSSKYLSSATLSNYVLKTGDSFTGNVGIGTAIPTISSLSVYTGTTSTNLSLVITAANPANQASIIFYNNLNAVGSIGLGGTLVGPYYSNNLYLTSPKDINFFVNAGSIPSMCILANGNTGIGTTNPTCRLSVNPTPVYGGVFDFTTCPCVITNPTPSSSSALNDPQPVLHLCREGTLLQSYAQRISFYLSRYENNAINSRTRCDIVLAENEFLNRNVMTLLSNGSVGIGTTASSASLSLYSTTQLQPRLILSGQEFYIPFDGGLQNSSAQGIAFLCGVNRAGNRQLWIGDSANLTQNGTNPVLRLTSAGYIDCIATNGITSLPLSIGNSAGINMGGNVNINNNGKIIFNEVLDDNRIVLWNGYGFGINGGTLRYNTGGDHRFYTGATTTMLLNSSGNMGIGTITPRARLDVYNGDIIARATNEGGSAGIYLGAPYLPDSAIKCAIIAQGMSSYSTCKLHLCVNKILNNSSTYNVGVADARLTIDTNGNVAIGQTSAAYPLVVSGTSGSYTITSMSKRYDEIGPVSNPTPYTMTGIVAYLNGNVLTPGFYVSFSDERLKKEIEDLSNDFALQTIMKLKPIKYNLIDNVHNNNVNYGFSAQEVQKVLPEAVISTKHYLPNIFQNVDKVDNNNSNIMIDAKIIGSNLNVNDNIKIINHSNEEQIKKIVSINDNVITLDSKIDNYKDEDPLFLYGKEEEDIRCVNHNFLYNVNIKATQVLYEIIMKQQEEIIKLTNVLITSNIISPL